MRQKMKLGVLTATALLLVVLGTSRLGTPSANAVVSTVSWISDYGNANSPGSALSSCADTDVISTIAQDQTVVVHTSETVILCIDAEDNGEDLSFDSDSYGEWQDPVCDGAGEVGDTDCDGASGEGTDTLEIAAAGNTLSAGVLVTFECESTYGRTKISIGQDVSDEVTFYIECRGDAHDVDLAVAPSTLEIAPARGNTAHALLTLTATDAGGNPAYAGDVLIDVADKTDTILPILLDSNDDDNLNPSPDVDFSSAQCRVATEAVDTEAELEAAEGLIKSLNTADPSSYADWESFNSSSKPTDVANTSLFYVDSNTDSDGVTDRTVAAAVLHCDVSGLGPGSASVTASVNVPGSDPTASATVTVIGPPASIVVEASPTELTCGEKATITVTVKDAIGGNVSDHTRVEIITNLGGVLGGTGAAAGFSLPTTPISSTAADTFGGVATAYLLTSNAHAGPYEILATSGGTSVDDYGTPTYLGGVFSTPPLTAQTTVTCTLAAPAPEPTITAPATGTGIKPPNTGDAGLLSKQSGSSLLLLALAGSAVAMALAGLTFKVVRR